MDAVGIVAGLKANAIVADAGMKTVSRLAGVTGANEVVLPVLAQTLGTVDTALGVLAGREAQAIIGPGVNFASDAKGAVASLARQAQAGAMPSESSIADAIRRVQLIGGRINSLE
jgi:hypothetical protein